MEKIRNLSIRKTIILYVSISVMISFFSGTVIMRVAAKTQQAIWWKYIDEEKYFKATEQEGKAYIASIPRVSADDMSRIDASFSEICDFLETYSILVFSIFGVVLSVILFYKDKIVVPLEKMTEASKMIANHNLDFQLDYSNQDELGRLCVEFEKMRGELEKNNQKMWHMVEGERALRAAIAHDIRTPLAVLKGYQEMMLEFIPENLLNKEKTMEMLQDGMKQVERINHFVETMRKLSSLEERKIQYIKTDLSTIKEQIEKTMKILGENSKKTVLLRQTENKREFMADQEIILEVMENLLSNSLRYAVSEIEILLFIKEDELEIEVRDDGKGFTISEEQATRAYFHSNPQDDLNHFGMGMYISKIYCEKHGGRLLVRNQAHGGGVVKAVFRIQ